MVWEYSGIKRALLKHLAIAFAIVSIIIVIGGYFFEYHNAIVDVKNNIIKELTLAKYTLGIAAYTDDHNMATETALALLKTKDVCYVEIKTTDNSTDLAYFDKNAPSDACSLSNTLVFTINSPIDDSKVGTLTVRINSYNADKKAVNNSLLLVMTLFFGLLVTIPVIWFVVTQSVTKPIVDITENLKHVRLKRKDKLKINIPHDSEISFIVDSINSFIDQINEAISKETKAKELANILQKQYLDIFEKATSGIVLSDENGIGTLANPAAGRLLQLANPNDIVGSFCLTERGWFASMLQNRDIINFATTLPSVRTEKRLVTDVKKTLKNRESWLQVAITELEESNKLQFTFIDITERKRLEMEALYKAEHDIMTGLLKKEAGYREIELRLKHCKSGETGAVIMMDIDHFKPINDTYGHGAGDIVIKEVSNRIRQTFRDEDITARYGGDEFLIGLFTIKDENDIHIICKRLLKNIKAPIVIKDEYGQAKTVSVGASIGVALINLKTTVLDLASVVAYADSAAYNVKQKGKNGYCLSNDGIISETFIFEKSSKDLTLVKNSDIVEKPNK